MVSGLMGKNVVIIVKTKYFNGWIEINRKEAEKPVDRLRKQLDKIPAYK